jgi:phosphotransferase system enzyme I (PtsP)
MAGRPVTLRTLDIGGDKQLPYFKTPHEVNPALGWRGLRVVLEWQDLLRVQLRAALRASAHGNLRILLPMVTSYEEVCEVRRIFARVREQLVEHGYEIAPHVPLGAMVEVPSMLFNLADILDEVEFVSVGTNDMVQYLLAADRDNPWVSRLYEPYHPAVWRALARVAEVARAMDRPCSVCGEMAGDPTTALFFLGLGFTGVSVAPNFLSEVKFAVRQTPRSEAVADAQRILELRSVEEIRALMARMQVRLHERFGVVARRPAQ